MTFLKKLQYNSPVVLSFFFLSLAALIANLISGGAANRLLFSVYRAPLTSPLTWLRFLTHVLGHGGYSHFIGNMMLFLVVGPPAEERYGSRNLLFAMALTAAVSGAVQVIFFPGVALLGASGLVFMLILLSSLAGAKSGRIPLTLLLVGALYLCGEIAAGLTAQDNISQITHILGGVCGGGLGLLFVRTHKSA